MSSYWASTKLCRYTAQKIQTIVTKGKLFCSLNPLLFLHLFYISRRANAFLSFSFNLISHHMVKDSLVKSNGVHAQYIILHVESVAMLAPVYLSQRANAFSISAFTNNWIFNKILDRVFQPNRMVFKPSITFCSLRNFKSLKDPHFDRKCAYQTTRWSCWRRFTTIGQARDLAVSKQTVLSLLSQWFQKFVFARFEFFPHYTWRLTPWDNLQRIKNTCWVNQSVKPASIQLETAVHTHLLSQRRAPVRYG